MMDEVVFLEELISIPSPSGKEGAVAAYLLEQMAALGYQVQLDAVGNVIGTLGAADAGRTVMLLGHMDTVPGVIPVRREGDKLYGRGAVDAKGPLAAFVLAAARAAISRSDTRLMVVGAVGEEAQSQGAHHLVNTVPPPDFVLIGEPSGWQGITLGYKGTLIVDYRLTRPRRHSASEQPPPAEAAVAFWNRLTAHAAALNQGQSRRFDTLDPTLRAIHTFGDGLEEGVEMSIGLRLPPGADVAGLQRQMQAWHDGARLAFPYSEPPFQTKKNTPLVRAFLRAIRAAGGQPRFKLKTGTSDMNVVGPAWGCPIVAYGPGDSDLDHTPDEYIEIEELRRGVDVLTRALEELVG
ncbi:MAG: [LysW]-lysine hydrolase [Anaerolineae bacterium]|nr:[LysW]-lysine hydrolase [Anaerolineae bacterium]